MSGQPSNSQSDVNKFRNEYMATLDLQDELNDYNLQANKTYLLTGALPPQSQIQDTRTNAEKLRDVELMKQNIAEQLRPIAEPSFAYAIVDKIMNSPLNIDNSLFRFLAQRAASITEQLKKIYQYGIAGDENDVLRIVEYIKNMYSETQGKFQTTKSYMNSIASSSSNSRVISANDIDNVILGLNDLIKNFRMLGQYSFSLYGLIETLNNLKDALPTTEELKLFLNEPIDLETVEGIIGESMSSSKLKAFFDLLEKLPKYTEVMALINKIKQYASSNNNNMVNDGISRLKRMFLSVEGIDNIRLLDEFKSIKNRQEQKINSLSEENNILYRHQLEEENDKINMAEKAQKVYIVNPESDAVYVRGNFSNPSATTTTSLPPTSSPPTSSLPTSLPSYTPEVKPTLRMPLEEKKEEPKKSLMNELFNAPRFKTRQTGQAEEHAVEAMGEDTINLRKQQRAAIMIKINELSGKDYKSLLEEINMPPSTKRGQLIKMLELQFDNNTYNIGDYGTKFGLGIRRRGRPRGGSIKPEPLPKPKTFIGFGINEINQKQLNNGIIKIRRNTKTNYMDMPSKRVSNNLKGIIKTIVGGGVPKFNELNSLDEDEKEYLHKIISRSSLEDKLSVPAPSKDQQEKDIHNFEVMRGQIMSGNDSVELVKKFKLLIRKLSKQGLLPKTDVDDLIDTLSDLNY